MTANHPDPDTLADLTADVLPPDLARAVESHVMGCGHCAAVLDGAERVRGLLAAADPGPMPDQLWGRLEQALLAEAAAGSSSTTGLQGRVPGNTTGIMRRVPGGQTGLQDAVPGGERPAERTQVLHRPGRIPQPTRRQARKDTRGRERTDTPSRHSRLPLVLAAAAALVAVATGGTLLVRNLGQDAPAGGAAASLNTNQEQRAAAGLTPVYATGTAYTTAQLAQQVNGLLVKPPDQLPVAKAPKPVPSADGADTAADTPGGGNSALADPATLAACLSALDTPPGSRPVAVDLGTFDGQEAALIVLPAREQGYEVWAVARSCNAADDATIAYREVKAQ